MAKIQPPLIVGLAVLCATYAYYIIGLGKTDRGFSAWFGLWGNLAVIVFTAFVAIQLWPEAKAAAYLVLPVSLWTAYATLIVIGEMKQQALI
ncbi:MAG: hypothetical protein IPN76_33620 [Saprospiraceae bacterium]|nr:hypothetical protein [Saprospiraceae bacterium]